MIYLFVFTAILVAIATIVSMVNLLYSGIRYVPYVPTENKITKQMIEEADLHEDLLVYDLGCGDGRLLIEAKKKYGVKAIGIEVSWVVSIFARLRMFFSAQVYPLMRKDFFLVDLKDADRIFCYLFPKVMNRLSHKFQKELKIGSKVISNTFPIEDWKPSKIIPTRKDKNRSLIYVYDIPQCYESS